MHKILKNFFLPGATIIQDQSTAQLELPKSRYSYKRYKRETGCERLEKLGCEDCVLFSQDICWVDSGDLTELELKGNFHQIQFSLNSNFIKFKFPSYSGERR